MKSKLITALRSTALAAALALGLANPVQAVPVISLDPVNQNIAVGGTAMVNLNISGLDAGTSLGAWLAYITYNSTIVSPTGVAFGTNLDLGVFGTLQFTDLTTVGLAKSDETSFEDPAALHAVQPGAFRLATLSFIGLAPGVSTLTFNRLELSDHLGFPLATTSSTATITVGTGVTVPDAGSMLVPLLACLGLVLFAQRRRVQSAT